MYCIQTQWRNLILSSFQGSTKSLTYTKQRNTLPRYVQLKRIRSSIKLQISKHQVSSSASFEMLFPLLISIYHWEVTTSQQGFIPIGFDVKIKIHSSVVRSSELIHNSNVIICTQSEGQTPFQIFTKWVSTYFMDCHTELYNVCGFVLENFCFRADFPVLRGGHVNLKSDFGESRTYKVQLVYSK